jgi:hypothetical protein
LKVSLVEDQPLDEAAKGSLQSYLSGLNIPQKVELAGKGNAEVRTILSRDPNRMVARAVIHSPKLSDADVASYAGSTQTNDDVLRAIAENRNWMSNRKLVTAIVSNPRTPPQVSIRFLGGFATSELGILFRNRNISLMVRREAKRIIMARG